MIGHIPAVTTGPGTAKTRFVASETLLSALIIPVAVITAATPVIGTAGGSPRPIAHAKPTATPIEPGGPWTDDLAPVGIGALNPRETGSTAVEIAPEPPLRPIALVAVGGAASSARRALFPVRILALGPGHLDLDRPVEEVGAIELLQSVPGGFLFGKGHEGETARPLLDAIKSEEEVLDRTKRLEEVANVIRSRFARNIPHK